MTETKPIRLMLKGALGGPIAESGDEPSAATLFSRVSGRLYSLAPPQETMRALSSLGEFVAMADALDSTYGRDEELPVADIEAATNDALGEISTIESWLTANAQPHSINDFDPITLGVALWAMRHRVHLQYCEPVVNALARRANDVASRQETAATYAFAQGLIAHLAPSLSADLERSNPERPWRILNINFAIIAIRTGDVALVRFAFDQLNTALPAEREGFYAEALALASQAGFPAGLRDLIAQECRRVAQLH